MFLPVIIVLCAAGAVALLLRAAIRHDEARRTRYGRRFIMNDGFGPNPAGNAYNRRLAGRAEWRDAANACALRERWAAEETKGGEA